MSELPDGWEWTTLAEVCASITDGDHQPPPQVPDGIPFLVIGNISKRRLDFEGCRYVPDEYFQALKPIRRPQKGDILYSLVGWSYGFSVLVPDDHPFCVQRHIGIIRPSSRVGPEFLSHLLNSRDIYNQATGYVTGSAQPTVPLSGLRRIRIPLPPRPEQDRIVAAIEEQFSRLDAGKSVLQRAQRNLKPARMSILDAAVSGKFAGIQGDWDKVSLGDVLDDVHAGKSFKCEERPSGLDEWGVVKVSAMTWGQFRETENKTVIDPGRADPRFEINPGDLLVSRANTVEYVGAAVMVGKCRPRLLLSDKSLRLVPNSRVLPEWLLINLRTPQARRYIESVATGTSDSMRNISQPKLKELRITLPPVDVQLRLAAEVDRVLSQIDQLDHSLAKTQRSAQGLRSSILSAAFSGMLT